MAMRKKTRMAMSTAKQERLAAIPSPNDGMTVEDAQNEIDILQNLLDTHGCPLTREYIRDASISADTAHKMAHTIVNEQVADTLVPFLQGAVADADKAVATLPTDAERSEFYARLTRSLLIWAGKSATTANVLLKKFKQENVRTRQENIITMPVSTETLQ
jgi:hypothetical protein